MGPTRDFPSLVKPTDGGGRPAAAAAGGGGGLSLEATDDCCPSYGRGELSYEAFPWLIQERVPLGLHSKMRRKTCWCNPLLGFRDRGERDELFGRVSNFSVELA